MSSNPKCPKCGRELVDPSEYFPDGEGVAEIECGNCEYEYRLQLIISYDYEALETPGGEG